MLKKNVALLSDFLFQLQMLRSAYASLQKSEYMPVCLAAEKTIKIHWHNREFRSISENTADGQCCFEVDSFEH
jgi:hypothetical protein